MTSHGQVAKSVREHKENHPDQYCPKCLWRTGGNYGYCPRHKPWAYPKTRNEPTGE